MIMAAPFGTAAPSAWATAVPIRTCAHKDSTGRGAASVSAWRLPSTCGVNAIQESSVQRSMRVLVALVWRSRVWPADTERKKRTRQGTSRRRRARSPTGAGRVVQRPYGGRRHDQGDVEASQQARRRSRRRGGRAHARGPLGYRCGRGRTLPARAKQAQEMTANR